jgi:hypothetical protein
MDKEHALGLLEDMQSIIDADRDDLKRSLDRLLVMEASVKLLKTIVQTLEDNHEKD